MIEIDIKKSLNTQNGKITLEVNTKIQEYTFLSIFGQSGAGKTTLLRILSGLDMPDSGKIIVDNEIWFDSDKKINLAPQKRKIGFVFQDYALFPHLNVYQNLCFGLESKKQRYRVDEILNLMQLDNLKHTKPNKLSGGQKQRVALARALVYKSKILLLDEPLSALDNDMRLILQDEIIRLHKYFKLTTIIVSHDISEIFKLSNRILHLKNGKIINDGDANIIFANNNISSKFSFSAKIIDIKQNGIIFIVKLLINNNIATITMDNDASQYKIGDEILVSTKAFNPIVFKI
ncbi:ATP-binding cassette domain-containing protein [Helicobacter sp. MIT 99-5507]|uniref:ATP-binding cassette domain-containing protein n=1 Tax=Helicobacter sp. MIT 99-5507 TaxID=152489 RepID=UPI000E1F7E18|nr:ATP-binding cassette domain-containing protein [Helicobacter sp. MIT 99-5507]RDU56772.1 molybdenum ABC transporter ATP-binding protein [Helicobacter sp. MIT 99-5507]